MIKQESRIVPNRLKKKKIVIGGTESVFVFHFSYYMDNGHLPGSVTKKLSRPPGQKWMNRLVNEIIFIRSFFFMNSITYFCARTKKTMNEYLSLIVNK
jgi:hypothetical protein